MSKRKSKNRRSRFSSTTFNGRVAYNNTRPPLPRYTQNTIKLSIARDYLVDNRTTVRKSYSRRKQFRPPLTIIGTPAPYSLKHKKGKTRHAQYAFTNPKITADCIRRSSRREVLFASRKAGKGIRHGRGSYRRTSSSQLAC